MGRLAKVGLLEFTSGIHSFADLHDLGTPKTLGLPRKRFGLSFVSGIPQQ